MIEETLTSADGTKLFLRSRPAVGRASAIVVIVPGFNSHSGYYGWVADRLAALGLSVYALDLRGRGQSDGERFYVERFEDYLADVDSVMQLARNREPGLPVFIFGHSAGGVVATSYALEHQAELAGLVCESFAFQVPAPDVALAVLKGLSHVAPHARVLKLKNVDFSRDPAVVAAMDADPLIANEVQPSQTVAEMVRADERLKVGFARITLPVLILHGAADAVTRPSGSQQFFDTAGSADKTLKLYPGHFHDLLNDLDRDLVMSDIGDWLTARLPVPA
jgi:alpha-beta hydrolase superfamily lysophospholipase